MTEWVLRVHRKVWNGSCRIEGQAEFPAEDWTGAVAFYYDQLRRYQGRISLLELSLWDGDEKLVLLTINNEEDKNGS